MHKIRLLCCSIAVTIATHKNSKNQRLSGFYSMRIGAHFAVFAILNYTKIIDNNGYLSHLFSYSYSVYSGDMWKIHDRLAG